MVADSAMFHVKHQNKGRFFGVPEARGYSGAVGALLRGPRSQIRGEPDPLPPDPSGSSPFWLQRSSARSAGGSETIRTPPILRNLAAHSAVTAGGPNARAVTRSKSPSNSGHRAASSALATTTSPLAGAPGRARASRTNSARFPMESRKTSCVCQRSISTRPGSPPPLPRSRSSTGGVGRIASQHLAKPSAWATGVRWLGGPNSPAPSIPRGRG